ncbi:MAG: hypothetical protein IJO48_05295 [Clostridia bacterium]|nr:hypothetical protein [Clostridia bacterium]
MNIFGLFFSFLIPGIVIGMLISTAIAECGKSARRSAERNAADEKTVSRNKLFVYSMADDYDNGRKLRLVKKPNSRASLYICSVNDKVA